MGRPSGDCNCHCGSGAGSGGGGGGGGPTFPTGINDPGCDTICAYGFLFAHYAPMSYPSGQNIPGDDLKYFYSIKGQTSQLNTSKEIKLSYESTVYRYYEDTTFAVGSGNAFVLRSPYEAGTQEFNEFASGTHIILNSSGYPFGVHYSSRLPMNKQNDIICQSGTYPIIDIKKFNSCEILPYDNLNYWTHHIYDYGISGTYNHIYMKHFGDLIDNNDNNILDNFSNCNTYYYNSYGWWGIDNFIYPYTANFRKLSLQHHDTQHNKFYWIPYVDTSWNCGWWQPYWEVYWYYGWDFNNIAYGSYALSYIMYDYDYFNNDYIFNFYNYDYDNFLNVNAELARFGYWYDYEYGPCHGSLGWTTYPTWDPNDVISITNNQYVFIDIRSHVYARGGRLENNSWSYTSAAVRIPQEQVSILNYIGLTFCENIGVIQGYTSYDTCLYFGLFELQVEFLFYPNCCGEFSTPIINIPINIYSEYQTERCGYY